MKVLKNWQKILFLCLKYVSVLQLIFYFKGNCFFFQLYSTLNRTIMNMALCLFAEAKVHKCYWPEIICAAKYLKNRTLANTIERKTPYEIFFKRKLNVEHYYNLRL